MRGIGLSQFELIAIAKFEQSAGERSAIAEKRGSCLIDSCNRRD